MPRRRLYLAALIVEAVLMGCAAALLAVSEKAEAAFPGKNGHIAYVSNDGEDHEIYAINGGGGGKVRLTDNATGDYEPSYSPGGKKIAYSGEDGPNGDFEIYTIKPGGGGKFKVTDNSTNDEWPSYSPSGMKIAYSAQEVANADYKIYIIKPGGGGKFKVTDNATDNYGPSWGSN
jgi:Tol biopolymer transport system component